MDKMISRLDWSLLRDQKLWLLGESDTNELAVGLVNLLDAIQDYAADDMGIPETEVFGPDYGKDDDDV